MNEGKGICYWITGLSASGKTVASMKLAELIRKQHNNIVLLDGDELRILLNSNSFSNSDRLALSHKYAQLANLISNQGIHVIIAVMALFHEVHSWNRQNISNYVEVFIDVPISELQRRDPKGLYRKYKAGEIKNMAGLDLKAELPINPDYHFDWNDNNGIEDIPNILLADFQSRLN
tara:strand:+ start:2012 stop:2539 length:528 start_codon:yes stop_codon:yes gene_type:complete